MALIHHAAWNGYTNLAQALLINPTNVNKQDKEDRSPLRLAAYVGNTEIVKALLAKNVDTNLPDKYGFPPLFCAAGNGHQEITSILALQAHINQQVPYHLDEAALHSATECGQEATVRILLEKDAKVDLENKCGDTPLLLAI